MAHLISVVLLFLQFAGWGTALAGMAILTNNCAKGVVGDYSLSFFGLNLVQQFQAGAGNQAADTSMAYQCGMQYSWYWTVIFLQLVAVLIGLAAQFSNHKSHMALIGMYGTVTALWTVWVYPIIANAYFYYTIINVTNNKWGQGYVVATAGAIAVLVGNYAFMFAQDMDHVTTYQHPPPGTVQPPSGGFQVA